MRKRPETSSSSGSQRRPIKQPSNANSTTSLGSSMKSIRSGSVWIILSTVIIYSCYSVHYYQFENLPSPLTADQAGKRGFSEFQAIKHVKALTDFGPHPVGSDSLDLALQYVLAEVENIKKNAYYEVDVEVDFFHAKTGANRLTSGLFRGKTVVYADLKHVVLRILPKFTANEAADNTILVSSHIDTVFSTGGAGDCSSCVAVMLELARGISQRAHGFKNGVIFLFNTGEEEGLSGAHSFITQHPWSKTIRLAVDLEAMGVGGKSGIFQAGPHPWAIENFASAAKYPSGNIIAQDLFSAGVIKSATDFQVYKDVAGLSGLDFAFTDNGAVYHTKNDKLDLLKSGSLQHLGENMLAFLLRIASSPHLPKGKDMDRELKTGHDTAIFFDILGTYMIVYSQRFASMLHNSVILQSLLIWAASLFMGGSSAIISLGLSCLSAILMMLFSISFSAFVAFILPQISPSPVPYVANPLLVLGLFAAPALLGALTGQHLGYLILKKYLLNVYSKKKQLPSVIIADLVKLEAERWLYKAGFVQWLVLLIVGNYYKIGSSYLAVFWLVPPAFAYGLLEATLTPARLPKPLKLATLLMGLAVPILISSGTFIRLAGTIIGMAVRFDRNPGGTPEWLWNVIISTFIAVCICLTFIYILSYVHISGAKRSIILAISILFGLSLTLVLSGFTQPFTEDTARAVNVVHVVDASGRYGEKQDPLSYISLFSNTPGKLEEEVEQIKEGFKCGEDKVVDFVAFSVNYGCWTHDDTESGWSESDIPTLHVDSDTKGEERLTRVSIDTKSSTRWSLAINTQEIEDFVLKAWDTGNSDELIPYGNKTSVDGWHDIQFSGGKESPRKFELALFWSVKTTPSADNVDRTLHDHRPLLKLRTDVDRLTPKAERVLAKLPPWCSLFGKSTSPLTLAFLSSLPVNF
ncbi:endoplasmic reticulum metallopeptidase [Salix suchowensis]|nr:endoplasmic reticulum metallopeptidase [Salix suchowensis]